VKCLSKIKTVLLVIGSVSPLVFLGFIIITGFLVQEGLWNLSLGLQIASYFWIGIPVSILGVVCGRILENDIIGSR
jgi:hypothetical protein